MEDGDFSILHYYTQKGFTLDYLLNLSLVEKLFYVKSMEIQIEREMKLWQASQLQLS